MRYRQLNSDEQSKIRKSLFRILSVKNKTIIDTLWDSNPYFKNTASNKAKWRKYKMSLRSMNRFSILLEQYYEQDSIKI